MTVADVVWFVFSMLAVSGAIFWVIEVHNAVRPRGLCHVCEEPMRVWRWQLNDPLSPWHHQRPACSLGMTLRCVSDHVRRYGERR